jgi:hypothetical protein
MSPRQNWDSSTPSLSPASVPLPPVQRGGGTLSAGEGLGESQFRRLEKSLALCLLCAPADPCKHGRDSNLGRGMQARYSYCTWQCQTHSSNVSKNDTEPCLEKKNPKIHCQMLLLLPVQPTQMARTPSGVVIDMLAVPSPPTLT